MKTSLIFAALFSISIASISSLAAEPDLSLYQSSPLPSYLSDKIEKYLAIRSPGLGLLSANGKSLVFTWQLSGTTQVWRLDGAKQFPVQLTGGPVSAAIEDVTPDGKWLVLSRSGDENLYKMPLSGGPQQALLASAKARNRFQFVSDDSKWVYYRVAESNAEDSCTISRVSLVDGRAESIIAEPGNWSVMDHQANGKLLLSKNLTIRQNEIYEWSQATRKMTAVMGQGEKATYDVAYGAKTEELLVRTDHQIGNQIGNQIGQPTTQPAGEHEGFVTGQQLGDEGG